MRSSPITCGLPAVHPGAILREDVIPTLGCSDAEIAEALGISSGQFRDILAEKRPITAALAQRVGELCGNGPTLWVNLQQAWDSENLAPVS